MLVRRVSWKEKSLLKHRAEIATEVRDNFFSNNESFL